MRQAPRSSLFPYTTLFRSFVATTVGLPGGGCVAATVGGVPSGEGVARGVRGASVAVGSGGEDRKSTRLNSSHSQISYAAFCLKKKTHSSHGSRLRSGTSL